MSSPPPASGARLAWDRLPRQVRAIVERRAGARVVAAADQAGGFSPGVAARLRLDDGGRLFVKAVARAVNAESAAMHRGEARTLPLLPGTVPTPRLRWAHDDGEWVVLGIEDVEGRSPALPWRQDDLHRVVAALPAVPCPPGLPRFAERMADAFRGWRRLSADPPPDLDPWERRNLAALAELEAAWASYADGDALLHSDLRADNLLLCPDGGVRIVDWAHACSGAPWVDLALLLTEADHTVIAVDDLLAGAPREGVDALLCAFAGFLAERCRRPAPPGLPTLRAYQRAYARSVRACLAHRFGS